MCEAPSLPRRACGRISGTWEDLASSRCDRNSGSEPSSCLEDPRSASARSRLVQHGRSCQDLNQSAKRATPASSFACGSKPVSSVSRLVSAQVSVTSAACIGSYCLSAFLPKACSSAAMKSNGSHSGLPQARVPIPRQPCCRRRAGSLAARASGDRLAALAGVTTIEHGNDGDIVVFRLMANRGVALAPTLAR